MKNKYYRRLLTIIAMLTVTHAQAHWNSKGPYGGSVKCMVTIDTNVIVGTAEGGVFINTTSAATTWKAINNGMTSGKIGAVTQLGRRIVAGTTDAGVFITSDRGANWAASNTGLTNMQVNALAFFGSNLFAGTSNGAFLSTDSGATWTSVNSGLTTTNIAAFAVDGTTLYAATDGGGVFVTTNAGTSWSAMNTGLSGSGLTLNSIAADGSMIYAGNTSGVYMYMGGSWSAFNAGLTSTYVMSLTMSGASLYAATDGGVFESVGMGNWASIATGLPTDTAMAVATIGTKIFAGTKNNGIYSSPIGTIDFVKANSSFNNLKTYAFTTQDTNTIVVATNKGMFLSTDLAASYAAFNTGLTDSLNINCVIADDVMKFAGTRNGGVFMSMGNGSWSAYNTGLTNLNVTALAANGLMASPAIYAATADGKIYMTTPAASSWTDISNGLPTGQVYNAIVVDGSTVYASSYGNGVFMYMGTSWSAFNTGLSNLNVSSLAKLNGKVFAGTIGGGVFVGSMPAGWMQMSSGLPSMNITSLASAAPYVAAGYRGGVHVTYDDGMSWQVPGVELNIPTFADVNSISFAATRVFAGTPNNSVYSNARTELPTGVIDIAAVKANGSVLIIPNPNKGGFVLQIANLKGAKIHSISMYDIGGRKVKQLENSAEQKVDAGTGVYFISVETDKGSLSQKMIVE